MWARVTPRTAGTTSASTTRSPTTSSRFASRGPELAANNLTPMADDASEPDAEQQFSALLEGLRATLPGVEVLFAFLLVLPFQNRFEQLGPFEERLYAVAFGAAGV